MIHRRSIIAVLLGLFVVAGIDVLPIAGAEERPRKLAVVASFSILDDLARRVGGDLVNVTTLVGVDGDAHVYEPTPQDARALHAADLLLINGLAFEPWIERLTVASGFSGRVVIASEEITPLRFDPPAEESHDRDDPPHGSFDPHAWQDPRNVMVYARTIAAAFAAADPHHADAFLANAAAYVAELAQLDIDLRASFGAVPAARRKVLTSHDAFEYFGVAYSIEFIAIQGLSTDAEPSAAEIAAIIDRVRREHITAIFLENIANPRLTQRIAEETGAAIGGKLYSDALSEPGGQAGTYEALMRWNAAQLLQALSAGE